MAKLPEAAGPLYEKVKGYILENIAAGVYARDARLPSEHELVERLGVSRMTVHRAMRELTSDGHLVRIQGVGTFVAAPKPQSALVEIRNIADEIRGRGHRHRSQVLVLESIATSPALTAAFEHDRPQAVFHSLVIHFEEDVAVQVEERFVNPLLAPDYDRQDFTAQTTYDYLQLCTPVSEVEHVISAVAADPVTADRLAIAEGEPCLQLHRRTWSGETVATVNTFTYAGARSALGSRYRANGR